MSEHSQAQRPAYMVSEARGTRNAHQLRGLAGTRPSPQFSSRNHQTTQRSSRRYVTERIDWPALHWLLRCPFVSADDLAAFCGMTHSTMARRLKELEAYGLVEWVTPACLVHSGVRRLYHLSNAGINLLAASLEVDARKLARAWECDERRLLQQVPQLPHLLRLQSVTRGLLMGAPQALSEQGHEASGSWHWVRNYRHAFSFHNRSQVLKLDAALVFHVTRIATAGSVIYAKSNKILRGTSSKVSFKQRCSEPRDHWYAALLLADAPVQDWRAAARTIDTLLSYRESPERWPVYDQFPPLLLLADNVRHVERWQQLARSCADLRQLPPLRGAIAVVPQPPQLTLTFDSWRLPWHDLVSGIPCHITQVMSPLSHDALLPTSDGSDAPRPLLARKRIITVSLPHARVVVGGLTRRALSVAAEPGQSDPHAGAPRESLRLLGLQLGSRLVEIMAMLLRVPGIQVVDLADLLEVQVSSVDRYLSELDRYGLLSHRTNASHTIGDNDMRSGINATRRGHFSYDPSTSVWLSHAGHWLATSMQRMSPRSQFTRRMASKQPGRHENVWTSSTHNPGVYHFFAHLAHAAAMQNSYGVVTSRDGLVWWEVGMLAERRYRYEGHWHSLRPDGAGCYQTGATRFRFWLEWDQGSMNLSDLTRKFISYYTYLASGAWHEASDSVIPHLLIVVQSYGQFQRMRKAAESASAMSIALGRTSALTHLNASMAYADDLETAGPLAPIWSSLMATSTSCRRGRTAQANQQHSSSMRYAIFPQLL